MEDSEERFLIVDSRQKYVLPPLQRSFKLIPPPDLAEESGKTVLWCVVSRVIL